MTVGISSIGISIPSLALPLTELARLRGVDPNKYIKGLACDEMALCSKDENIVQLATNAAEKALAHYPKGISNIGLLAVGTESAVDMSRPLSAWVGESLGLCGTVRSYEVKHACYGGMVALRQAIEWKLARPNNTKAALVIAADVALYSENDPGEPTQGAGAVAFVIDDAVIASLSARSYAFSEPVFDFWRPVGDEYPKVDGPFSLECYIKACQHCFQECMTEENTDLSSLLALHKAVCFHVPFPKMVKKAFLALAESYGLSSPEVLYQQLLEPYMEWNTKTGNLYTGSLWLAVANALGKLKTNEHCLAFSYGSGCGAELMSLTATMFGIQPYWVADFERQLAARTTLTGEEYLELRKYAKALPSSQKSIN